METNQCMCYQVPFTMLTHILWLPKQAWSISITMHMHNSIKIFSLRSYRYIYVTNKPACARIKNDSQDDDKMNTLAFVNFLFVKLFSTLIRQNFPPSKFCAIWY